MLSTSRSKQAVLSRLGYAVTSNLPSPPQRNRVFFNSCVVERQMALLGTRSNGHSLVCGVVCTANVLRADLSLTDGYAQ
jgi:hypothetical protein